MPLRTLCFSLMLLSLTAAARCAGPITVHNEEIGFSLTAPTGFEPLNAPNLLRAFQDKRKVTGVPEATIAVQRLGGVIGRDPLDLAAARRGFEKTAPPGFHLTDLHVLPEPWKGFQLDATRADESGPAGQFVT
jgi:hypothetical protein